MNNQLKKRLPLNKWSNHEKANSCCSLCNNRKRLYGQTAPENRWLLGKCTGTYRGFDDNTGIRRDMVDYNIELVFNDNGTGVCNDSGSKVKGNDNWYVLRSEDFVFAINGNRLIVFYSSGTRIEFVNLNKE
jgi:hypothetical protein